MTASLLGHFGTHVRDLGRLFSTPDGPGMVFDGGDGLLITEGPPLVIRALVRRRQLLQLVGDILVEIGRLRVF